MSRSGIVNVRMVITEEKILSNIDKIEKMINPKSKKQIVQLEDDSYFKDLIESIKTYLVEYPKKKNFPASVYKAAYGLVEYATNQFEENTKQIEDLIRQREANISSARVLKDALDTVENKEEGWKQLIEEIEEEFPEDIIDTLRIIGKSKSAKSQNHQDAVKLINARIVNLESNLHIEIDMERIEDRSKALSYIGIEIADALKLIPAPQENYQEVVQEEAKVGTNAQKANAQEMIVAEQKGKVFGKAKAKNKVKIDAKLKENIAAIQAKPEEKTEEQLAYEEETTFEVKPSLWQKIKQSKVGRAVRYLFKIRVVLEVPALPEGTQEQ